MSKPASSSKKVTKRPAKGSGELQLMSSACAAPSEKPAKAPKAKKPGSAAKPPLGSERVTDGMPKKGSKHDKARAYIVAVSFCRGLWLQIGSWMNPDEAFSAHTETRHTVRIASQMRSSTCSPKCGFLSASMRSLAGPQMPPLLGMICPSSRRNFESSWDRNTVSYQLWVSHV